MCSPALCITLPTNTQPILPPPICNASLVYMIVLNNQKISNPLYCEETKYFISDYLFPRSEISGSSFEYYNYKTPIQQGQCLNDNNNLTAVPI